MTMGSKILDEISYVKTISKQKVTIIRTVKCLGNNNKIQSRQTA